MMISSSSAFSLEKREEVLYFAKLSEQAERFQEMVEYMKIIAKSNTELSVEERNLLSVAYKNIIGSRRGSWRIVNSILQKEELKQPKNPTDLQHIQRLKEYKCKIETELTNICSEILDVLNENLIPNSRNGESKVFHYKMLGDYYRYIAEYSSDNDLKQASRQSKESYVQAIKIAKKELTATHPIRLGLILNFSVFYYEILRSPEKARSMAMKAFDEAGMTSIHSITTIPNLTDHSILFELF